MRLHIIIMLFSQVIIVVIYNQDYTYIHKVFVTK